ncbi:hypothetical protein, partial [Azospirillum sp. B4]|uniref:hypothetical protein n=1 Tax=Azospirillum sp. B4 TaxID=95605 RepID=UPI001B3BC14F
ITRITRFILVMILALASMIAILWAAGYHGVITVDWLRRGKDHGEDFLVNPPLPSVYCGAAIILRLSSSCRKYYCQQQEECCENDLLDLTLPLSLFK